LRELLAGHDETILDPLDARSLAARRCTSKAASGLSALVVRGRGFGVRHSGFDTLRPWQLQPLPAHRQAQAAEVCAQAPNGGLELHDAAQQSWGTEIGAHLQTLSKFGQPGKCSKRRDPATPTGGGRGGLPLVLARGEPSANPAVPADEEVTAKALDFMQRTKQADKPFFVRWNPTRMHIFKQLQAPPAERTWRRR
jgi:hypothetical protein